MTEAISTATLPRTLPSDAALRDALQNFSTSRQATIRMAATLTADQAAFTPAPGVWSAAQNLDHLLVTEGLYRTQLARLLRLAAEPTGSNIDISLSEVDLNLPFIPRTFMPLLETPLTIASLFIPHAVRETLLRFPIMKAKHPKVAEPAPSKPLDLLQAELSSALAGTEALFSGGLPPRAARVTVTHPVFGRNTIANILRLMAAHEDRHRTQISRLLTHPAFPATIEGHA